MSETAETGEIEPGQIEDVETTLAVPVASPAPHPGGEFVREPGARALIRSVAPSAQTAAVAAGGFVAGAAIAGLAKRRRGRGSRAGRRRAGAPEAGRARELLQIVGTRSLLVDVHLLDGPSTGR